ncbi:MAG: hypothetical protein NTV76_05270 [Pseudomonas sp.]|nr:hypothetical protein [Pseudomonas sp.]
MNKYISGKVLFSKTPYGIQSNYTTKTSLYKIINDSVSTLTSSQTTDSLMHKWWEFEFIVEQASSEAPVCTYRIVAEVFLPEGELLAKADELLSVDFNYGTRHHEDVYLKPVFIV